jgi:hypothetical protein
VAFVLACNFIDTIVAHQSGTVQPSLTSVVTQSLAITAGVRETKLSDQLFCHDVAIKNIVLFHHDAA